MKRSMKLVVIVGGSAGLGLVLAERLAVAGTARIVLVARNAERLQAVSTHLRQQYPQTDIQTCAVDITNPDGAATLAACLSTHSHPVDLLINAVGLSDRGTLLGLEPHRIEELIRANVIGPLLAVQALVPLMHSGSVIVNIGSLASYLAPSYLGGYSIVKHGLRAFAQQLRIELAPQGIHVLLVCPGPIARADTGTRYQHLKAAGDIPAAALQAAGGAKIKGLDPEQLAADILRAISRRQPEIIRPRKARLLVMIMAAWPRLGEWILKRKTAG